MAIAIQKIFPNNGIKPPTRNKPMFSATNDNFLSTFHKLAEFIRTKVGKPDLQILPEALYQSNRQASRPLRLFDFDEPLAEGYLLLRGQDINKQHDTILDHLKWLDAVSLKKDLRIPSQLLFLPKDSPKLTEVLEWGSRLKNYDQLDAVGKAEQISIQVYHQLLKPHNADPQKIREIIKTYPPIVTLEHALNKGAGNCGFTSLLYKAISDRAGVPSTICHGYKEGVPHFWNEVEINGKRYLMDVSGGVPLTEIAGNEKIKSQYRSLSSMAIY